MKFYDSHMHSYLSFDCKEEPKNYAYQANKLITFTDHLDLANTANNGQDDIPDFAQILTWKKAFQEEEGVELLLGVEIGYVPAHYERLQEILGQFPFELKLLSVHQNANYDYMDQVDVDAKVMIQAYLEQLLMARQAMKECHILTHFEYGFRIHDLSMSEIESFESLIRQIFKHTIENGLALELNSKSLYKYDNYDIYDWAIPIYQSLGGKRFSLGSDAHSAKDQFWKFEDSIALLKQHQVQEISLFKGPKHYTMSLDEVRANLEEIKS